jgi:hypothetical protein
VACHGGERLHAFRARNANNVQPYLSDSGVRGSQSAAYVRHWHAAFGLAWPLRSNHLPAQEVAMKKRSRSPANGGYVVSRR